jgi:hypothetical protein
MRNQSKTTIEVFCGGCGAVLVESPSAPVEFRIACSCGSVARFFKCDIETEKVRIRTSISARQKRPGIRGWLVEMVVGKQPRKGPGGVFIEWVDKYWRIDKPSDRCIEHVVTETGEVLRDVNEPLSRHFGHGSDKPELKASRLAKQALTRRGNSHAKFRLHRAHAERLE